jgi:hypothetical protein
MDIIVLKLLLTPLFIAALTLIGRRWGPGASGAVAGLPLTSGPISDFLALEQGAQFAVDAAAATLAGLIAVAAFCLAYAITASRKKWIASTIAALAAFFLFAALLLFLRLEVIATFIIVALVLAMTLWLFPKGVAQPNVVTLTRPKGDFVLRIVIATALVFLLTAIAPRLGPQATGLVSPFPIFGGMLAIFAHRHASALDAQRVLRGVLVASFAFAVFFLIVGEMLPRYHVGVTYVLASVVGVAVNIALFQRMRRKARLTS